MESTRRPRSWGQYSNTCSPQGEERQERLAGYRTYFIYPPPHPTPSTHTDTQTQHTHAPTPSHPAPTCQEDAVQAAACHHALEFHQVGVAAGLQ